MFQVLNLRILEYAACIKSWENCIEIFVDNDTLVLFYERAMFQNCTKNNRNNRKNDKKKICNQS